MHTPHVHTCTHLMCTHAHTLVGASLSEPGSPHTSVTSLHMCVYAYLDRPLTVSHFRLLFRAFCHVSCINFRRAQG